MSVRDTIINCFSGELLKAFAQLDDDLFTGLEEIRLRVEKPVILKIKNAEVYLKRYGKITTNKEYAYIPTSKDITNVMERISNYSVYSVEEELKNGFVTIEGGHRVGITGSIIGENGNIKGFRHINSMNIRIACEYKGCGDKVMKYVVENGRPKSTMIISPPGCGKTTLLRDIVRQISNSKNGLNVGLVDERNEISASYKGIPQKDVGIRTDVIDCCKKSQGMTLLLRSMSPNVIAVDEIGSKADADAVEEIMTAGVKIICTVHGNDLEEVLKNKDIKKLIDKNIFEIFIVLTNDKSTGEIKCVYNKQMEKLGQGV